MAARTDNPRRQPEPPRLWTYTLPGGHRVMAGKTDADNDRLSLKIAGPGIGGSMCAACPEAMWS